MTTVRVLFVCMMLAWSTAALEYHNRTHMDTRQTDHCTPVYYSAQPILTPRCASYQDEFGVFTYTGCSSDTTCGCRCDTYCPGWQMGVPYPCNPNCPCNTQYCALDGYPYPCCCSVANWNLQNPGPPYFIPLLQIQYPCCPADISCSPNPIPGVVCSSNNPNCPVVDCYSATCELIIDALIDGGGSDGISSEGCCNYKFVGCSESSTPSITASPSITPSPSMPPSSSRPPTNSPIPTVNPTESPLPSANPTASEVPTPEPASMTQTPAPSRSVATGGVSAPNIDISINVKVPGSSGNGGVVVVEGEEPEQESQGNAWLLFLLIVPICVGLFLCASVDWSSRPTGERRTHFN